MRRLAIGAVCALVLGSLPVSALAAAPEGSCADETDLYGVKMDCEGSVDSIESAQSSDPSSTWTMVQICREGAPDGSGVCTNPRACTINGTPGTWYSVKRNGVHQYNACLTAEEEAKVGAVNVAGLAVKAFRELDWPKSELVVQPPGGRTLVNFETVFHTTNSGPTTRSVELLGKTVEIEATPTYVWHFGDGESVGTDTAGLPHPGHAASHVYTSLDEVAPWVDTTYSGRYRVDGGEWKNISETLTVAGDPVTLTVLEAKPVLVQQ